VCEPVAIGLCRGHREWVTFLDAPARYHN
jgi:hypothetical protein